MKLLQIIIELSWLDRAIYIGGLLLAVSLFILWMRRLHKKDIENEEN